MLWAGKTQVADRFSLCLLTPVLLSNERKQHTTVPTVLGSAAVLSAVGQHHSKRKADLLNRDSQETVTYHHMKQTAIN